MSLVGCLLLKCKHMSICLTSQTTRVFIWNIVGHNMSLESGISIKEIYETNYKSVAQLNVL